MNMADPKDVDTAMEDDYDEEADGDFDGGNESDGIISSSSEDGDSQAPTTTTTITTAKRGRGRPRSQAKRKTKPEPETLELDSGDEATIRERNRNKEKKKQRAEDDQDGNSDIEEQGWRARTRAMREKEQVEKKRSKLASVKGSTIDVDQIWENMNKSGGLKDVLEAPTTSDMGAGVGIHEEQKENLDPTNSQSPGLSSAEGRQSQRPQEEVNDMITIDETYEFAGEVHTRKKTIPRTCTEAKLWLSRRSSYNSDARFPGIEPVRRPLRKISRFDPNIHNLEGFQKNWQRSVADGKGSKVQKLNTVEKSKMDWAAHVNEEGLQDELIEHAKAKGGYLGRMDFLGQVEQRKEDDARRVRAKGR
jgi:Bucentaur or craniofacial development